MTRGALIIFEGLDRAGKSTQCVKLVERLSSAGHKVKHVRFPDRTTPIGKMIDEYLRGQSEQDDHAIHLLFSANRWEASKSILEAIEAGITVVVDRYIYSGCVYSAAKQNPLLDLAWARRPEVGLPRPDVCLFLELTPEEAAQRGDFGSERYENRQHQDNVRRLFQTIRGSKDGEDFVTVDAGKSTDELANDIWYEVQSVLERVRTDAPLRRIEE